MISHSQLSHQPYVDNFEITLWYIYLFWLWSILIICHVFCSLNKVFSLIKMEPMLEILWDLWNYVMTLRYILTNVDYTLCAILISLKLLLMTLDHILTNVVCDLHEWISLTLMRTDVELWCKIFVSAQRWCEVIMFISLYNLYNISPTLLSFI